MRGPAALALALALLAAAACPAQQSAGSVGFEDLAESLRQAESELALQFLSPTPQLGSAELQSYESLHRQIEASFYGELIDRSRFLVLLARALAAPPPQAGAPEAPPGRRLRRPTRILLGTAAASFGLSFSLWAIAERQDSLYFSSLTVDEALAHRRWYQVCGLSSLILAGIGALSSGASVALLLAEGS